MALTKPTMLSVAAFDKANMQKFFFRVVGGSQVTGNRLTIKKNDTLELVYQQTQTTFAFEHILNANTLNNGSVYQATIETVDAGGHYSDPSEPIIFYCFTEPTFQFANMPLGNIIPNSSYMFGFNYSQTELEPLASYIFILYNSEGEQISTSGTKYVDGSYSSSLFGSHLFTGLEDQSAYQIECRAITKYNTELTTGKVAITVSYSQPSIYSPFEVIPNCSQGYVLIKSNLNNIGGSSPFPLVYEDVGDNTLLDIKNGQYVEWTDQVSFPDNYSIQEWIDQVNYPAELYDDGEYTGEVPIMTLTSKNGATVEIFLVGDFAIDGTAVVSLNAYMYARAKSKEDKCAHIIKANVDPSVYMSPFTYRLTRFNNLYELEVANY